MTYFLFIDYLQNTQKRVQCRQFATYVLIMHAWVGRDKHFTQYMVRIPAEAPNAYAVNYLHLPANPPDTSPYTTED